MSTLRLPPAGINRRGRQDGATLAEFAIVAPLALLLVLGLIQLGLMYSAKQVVNSAAFLAARAGSVENAQLDKMTDAMTRGLIPFYQNTTNSDDFSRLQGAMQAARNDTACGGANCFLTIKIENPTPEAFADFGITSGSSDGHTYIPNDNLEYRPHDVTGEKSGLSLQDANTLKIKVTYGYELKVPLMKIVIASVMCAIDTGVDAFGRGKDAANASAGDCANFYKQGRVPIVSYATVQMQTPAFEN